VHLVVDFVRGTNLVEIPPGFSKARLGSPVDLVCSAGCLKYGHGSQGFVVQDV